MGNSRKMLFQGNIRLFSDEIRQRCQDGRQKENGENEYNPDPGVGKNSDTRKEKKGCRRCEETPSQVVEKFPAR